MMIKRRPIIGQRADGGPAMQNIFVVFVVLCNTVLYVPLQPCDHLLGKG